MKLSARLQRLLGLACMLHFGAVGYLLGSAIFGSDAEPSEQREGGSMRADGVVSFGARFVPGSKQDGRGIPLAPQNEAPAVKMKAALDAAVPVLYMHLGHVRSPEPPPAQETAKEEPQQQEKEDQAKNTVRGEEEGDLEAGGAEVIYDEELSAEAKAKIALKRELVGSNLIPAEAAAAKRLAEEDPNEFTKLLKMQWPMHLGFNNVRFQFEIAIYLASLLKRQLVAPARLRMRDCLDKALCEKSRCSRFLDENWWCPTELFLDADMLKFGADVLLVLPDDESLQAGLSSIVVPNAFDRMYADDAVWVERLPYQIRQLIGPDHVHPPSEGNGTVALHYQKFDLGCELSYNHQRTFIWGDEPGKVEVYGFWDEFKGISESVLNLQGEVLRVGKTPVAWASPDAVSNFRRLKTRSVQYHSEVKRLALEAVEYIVGKDSVGNMAGLEAKKAAPFTCVHLRRGDFVTAGWLGEKVGNISKVASSLLGILGPTDRLYIATDETDLAVLQPLTDLGAVLWRDVVDILRGSPETLLQFGDYVGLVEQMICAHAETFIGSKCSSFTGGIFNLRTEILSDYSKQSLGDLMKEHKSPESSNTSQQAAERRNHLPKEG